MLLRGQVLFYNIAIGANLILINALRLVNIAYNGVLLIFNGLLKGVTVTMRLFGLATTGATGPLGVLLAIMGLLGSALLGFSKAIAGGANELEKQNLKLHALNDIQRDASRIYTEQIAKIDSWIIVIKSAATSIDTKRLALQKLVEENQAFSSVLKDNVIDLKELEKAYKKVTAAIIAQATVEASKNLTAQKRANLIKLTTARQQVEIATARGQDFDLTKLKDVPKEVTDILRSLPTVEDNDPFRTGSIFFSNKELPKVIAEIKKQEEQAAAEFKTYFEAQLKSEEDLLKFLEDGIAQTAGIEVDIKALKEKIENLDKEINAFQGSKADLTKKAAEREKLQDELDKLLNKNQKKGSTRGSRLTGPQKDAFKDIDAVRDRLNATDEKRRIKSEVDEETYLNTIFATNVDAINKKLKLLQGANAEERKQIADFNLDKVKLEQEVNDKLFELKEKAYKDQLDITARNAQEQADLIIKSPDLNVSPIDKAQAQLDADKKILQAQLLFNQQMDALEKTGIIYQRKTLRTAHVPYVRSTNRSVMMKEKLSWHSSKTSGKPVKISRRSLISTLTRRRYLSLPTSVSLLQKSRLRSGSWKANENLEH